MPAANRKSAPRKAGDMGRSIPDIFVAAASDSADGIDAALAAGVDVNSVDSELMTPLHHAAANVAFRAVARLLKELNARNPIDPTLTDRYGRSASAIALEVRGVDGVEMARKLRPFCYSTKEIS